MSRLPIATDIISVERERWAKWRVEQPPEPPEVMRVRQIADAMDALRWKDQPAEQPPSHLALAVCDDRWDLIRKATELIERDWLPRSDPRRLASDAKWVAFCLATNEKLKLGKADILDYIEAVHPEIFATIPRTLKARSTWWAEVGGDQVRDGVSPEWKSRFTALITTAIRNKNAGFPDFLGPRENPSWD